MSCLKKEVCYATHLPAENASKYSMQGMSATAHGILDQLREIVLALLPSFTLILGALILIPLRGRRSQSVSLISAGFAVAGAMVVSRQLPVATTIALWRPIELFGPGFLFSIDKIVWPFLLLGSVVVFAEALLDGRSMIRLLYAGLALAAIAGGSLLTIAMLWTLMILVETALQLRGSVEIGAALRKSGIQFVAVAAAMAAATLGQGAAVFLTLAALIRSLGGTQARFPLSLAIMAPLGALAAVSRYSPQYLWIAGAVVAIALGRAVLSKLRLPTLCPAEGAQRVGRAISDSMAAAVRTTAEALEGESAVLWILLVLLIAIIGLQAVAA